MGKKYATLFIPNFDSNDEDKIRTFYAKRNSTENRRLCEAIESICFPPEAERMMLRQLALSEPFVVAIQNSHCLAVYDENSTVKKIMNSAKKLAFATDKPLLFAANYDDDVFFWGECHPDGVKSCEYHLSHPSLAELYGDGKFAFNRKPAGGWLCEPIYPQISAQQSIEAIEAVFEAFLGLPLCISAQELHLEGDTYQQVSDENGLVLYYKKG